MAVPKAQIRETLLENPFTRQEGLYDYILFLLICFYQFIAKDAVAPSALSCGLSGKSSNLTNYFDGLASVCASACVLI